MKTPVSRAYRIGREQGKANFKICPPGAPQACIDHMLNRAVEYMLVQRAGAAAAG